MTIQYTETNDYPDTEIANRHNTKTVVFATHKYQNQTDYKKSN